MEGQLIATYRVVASAEQISAVARAIAIEQTAEVNEPLCATPPVSDRVVGRVEDIEPDGPDAFKVVIAYNAEVLAGEISQLFSVLFGNISLKSGIRLVAISASGLSLTDFPGPLHGIDGLRELVGATDEPRRPLLFGAAKPMGRSVAELAGYVHDLALGGLDYIKDDHGITDQGFAPFEQRVLACCSAVERANAKSGRKARYVPCVNAPLDQILDRARFALSAGAGGLLVSPLVVGMSAPRVLSSVTGLPVLAHPAMAGVYYSSPDHGIASDVVLGSLFRLAGADAVIFPGFGGRFPFTKQRCAAIDRALKVDMGGRATSLPVPAGGLTLDVVPEASAVFGRDVGFLIGSALYEMSPDLVANARHFSALTQSCVNVESH